MKKPNGMAYFSEKIVSGIIIQNQYNLQKNYKLENGVYLPYQLTVVIYTIL